MLITKAHLHSVAEAYMQKHGLTGFVDAIGQTKHASKSGEITVFISHKHDEKNEVKEAITLFHSLGVTVYVDWLDETMPAITTGRTAELIKQKIKTNKKFILLATDAAINSKWCNWELGYGDAHKFSDDIAIFPLEENNRAWSGSEYLQIYPYIETQYKETVGHYYVNYNGAMTKLTDWLRR